MLQKSVEQDKLITDTLDKIYEGNVEVTKKHLEKVLNGLIRIEKAEE